MLLALYMVKNGLNDVALAKKLGIKSISVSRYRRGKRIPDKATMRKIRRLTKGAVTADDFYDTLEQPRGSIPEHAQ